VFETSFCGYKHIKTKTSDDQPISRPSGELPASCHDCYTDPFPDVFTAALIHPHEQICRAALCEQTTDVILTSNAKTDELEPLTLSKICNEFYLAPHIGAEEMRESENIDVTNRLKISPNHLESAVVEGGGSEVVQEKMGIFMQESSEDDADLIYIPTTLPLEKSVGVQIVPVKDRCKEYCTSAIPLQRPRSSYPLNPASLNEYINNTFLESNNESAKMKINLPREDSMSNISDKKPKSPKNVAASAWVSFASMGLRNPREERRKMSQNELE
jgi:hypothetical protein